MFAAKTHPLTQFLCENALTPMEDEVSRRAFEQLKLVLQVVPIFQTLDLNKPFLIYYDAFGEVVGHSSDIRSIRFKHTCIIHFLGLFKKYGPKYAEW